MRLVLKPGKTIINPQQTGQEISTAIAKISHVENSLRRQTQIVRVEIFVSLGDTGRQPMQHSLAKDYQVTGQEWQDFFTEEKQEPAGVTLYSLAYDWLLVRTNEDTDELTFGDWELSS